MILQDMRRHLFRTLYYVYDVYKRGTGVSGETAEMVQEIKRNAYWAAPDYMVQNGQFVLVNPRLVDSSHDTIIGMWTISASGQAIDSGTIIYRFEEKASSGNSYISLTKYTTSQYGYKPGEFVRRERTTKPKYPTNAPSGNYWYQLVGVTGSKETEWYWEYTKGGVFTTHTRGVYRVTCVAGGGGGGAGGDGSSYGGGGGGSGYPGTATVKELMLMKGETYKITIGEGGSAGVAGYGGASAQAGSDSTFGQLITSAGGKAGGKGQRGTGTGGGYGGTGANGGKDGSYGRGGTGGARVLALSNTWRYPNGIGGAGGNGSGTTNGTGEDGKPGTAGIVIVEFVSA